MIDASENEFEDFEIYKVPTIKLFPKVSQEMQIVVNEIQLQNITISVTFNPLGSHTLFQRINWMENHQDQNKAKEGSILANLSMGI